MKITELMKRTLCKILVAGICLNVLAGSGAYAQSQLSEKEESELPLAVELMEYIGVIDEGEAEEKSNVTSITRYEFSEYLAKLLSQANFIKTNNVYYRDSFDYPQINSLTEMGVFSGENDGNFYPDRSITVGEAYVALVRALGYGPYAEAQGNNIYGYMSIAKDIDVHIKANVNEDLTFNQLMLLLMYSSHAPLYIVEEFKASGYVMSNKSGDTLLSKYYDINIVEGYVQDNGITGLRDKTSIGKDEIKISGTVYNCESENKHKMIGAEVKAFYDSELNTIIAISQDNEQLDPITFDAKDYSVMMNKYSYKMARDMVVIYNGVYRDGVAKNLMQISQGSITLLKAEGSSEYNVAVVNEHSNKTVGRADTYEGKIYFEDGTQADLEKTVLIEDADGTYYGLNTLMAGEYVSVISSLDGTFVRVVKAGGMTAGLVKGIDTNEFYAIIKCEDGNLEAAADFNCADNGVVIGAEGTFYLDMTGRVCGFKITKTEYVFGYIYKIILDDDDTVNIRIYNQNKEHLDLKCHEKVSLDGVGKSMNEVYDILAPGGVTVRQLVRYKLNNDGNIRHIDTAAPSEAAREGENTLYVVAPFASYKWNPLQKQFMPYYPVSNSTVGLYVPDDSIPASKNMFSTITRNSFSTYAGGTNYTVALYKTNPENPYMEAMVRKTDNNAAVLSTWTAPTGDSYKDILVNRTFMEVNADDEAVWVVEGLLDGQASKTYKCLPDPNNIMTNVGQGDIIRVDFDRSGQVISKVDKLLDYDEETGEITGKWGSEYASAPEGSNPRYIIADVLDTYIGRWETAPVVGYIRYADKDDIENTEKLLYLNVNFRKYIFFDPEKSEYKAYVGSIEDVVGLYNCKPGEQTKIFMRQQSSETKTYFFYK